MVDLLIAMANAAANSQRAQTIFDPFPSIVHPDNPNELALDPKVRHCVIITSNNCASGRCLSLCLCGQTRDFDLVRTVLKLVVESREKLLVRCVLFLYFCI